MITTMGFPSSSNSCSRLVTLVCLVSTTLPSARAAGRDAGSLAGTCGFVAPCGPVRHGGARVSRSLPGSAPRMTVSEGTEASTPYSDLPADWRAPLPPREARPKKGQSTAGGDGNGGSEGSDTLLEQAASAVEDGLRTPAEVLQEATRVTPGNVGGGARRPEAPPGLESLQTENQRRRALPLSKLKRIKPKKRAVKEEPEGEFRPLVLKTDRESVLRGEDYWIDYKEVDKKKAIKEAKAKAPAPDQFAQSKMKAEIVNPYKQNWILVISIAIVAIAGFVRLNPGILDDPSIITFPNEL